MDNLETIAKLLRIKNILNVIPVSGERNVALMVQAMNDTNELLKAAQEPAEKEEADE